MNILLSIIDTINILLKAIRYSVINIPFEDSSSKLIQLSCFLNPFYFINFKISKGQRLKKFLESLGPMFIKFGQLLSTRTDLMPSEITNSLKDLTDQCKPFPTKKAIKIIEKSLNITLKDIFEDFEEKPLAAASLAQVHKAKLKKSSENIVIKVLRPKIQKKVKRNIGVMRFAGAVINLFYKESYRLKLNAVINDY